MKSLSNALIKILFFVSLIFINSCTERELFDRNFILPSITGLYTEISGSISGRLVKKNSPYLVTKDLIVESEDSLTIEPGTVLYFNERSKFIIKGFLNATGTRNQRIYFSAYKSSWNGISFNSSNKNSIIRFCIIEKINPIEDNNPLLSGMSFINSYCTLQNNFLRDNSLSKGNFISSLNSSITVTNNIFLDNLFDISLISSDNNSLRLINNVFFNNKSNNNQSIVSIKKSIYNEIQNNIFFRNIGEEIKVTDSEPQKVILGYNFFGSTTNDPQFWNYETFRLYYLSPCKDAGNPAPEFNDIDGSRNDQGAYGGPNGNW